MPVVGGRRSWLYVWACQCAGWLGYRSWATTGGLVERGCVCVGWLSGGRRGMGVQIGCIAPLDQSELRWMKGGRVWCLSDCLVCVMKRQHHTGSRARLKFRRLGTPAVPYPFPSQLAVSHAVGVESSPTRYGAWVCQGALAQSEGPSRDQTSGQVPSRMSGNIHTLHYWHRATRTYRVRKRAVSKHRAQSVHGTEHPPSSSRKSQEPTPFVTRLGLCKKKKKPT